MKIRKKSYNPSVAIDKAVGLYMPFHCDNCIHRLRVSHENYGFGLVCPYCKEGIICPDPSFHAGEQVGPYIIDGWLARGAMGEVYYAHSTKSDKTVALKILNTDIGSEYALSLFQQEAYIMGHFEHPCLPVISSTNQHESFYYLAMQYIEGEGYDTVILREQKLTQKYVIEVMLKIADLLEHVWSKFGAIHRDIKPANIMVTEDDKVVLIDWGLAHIYNNPIHNDTGITFGTPEYICPVIVCGETNPDYRTDIYSLGATAFHMVTGSFPFLSEDPEALIDMVVDGPVPKAIEHDPSIDPGFSAILEKMMSKTYEERYISWEDFRVDIQAVYDKLS